MSNWRQNIDKIAAESNVDVFSEEFAAILNENDELKQLRHEFHYPKMDEIPKGNVIFEN